jgi:lipoate-protein ligase A
MERRTGTASELHRAWPAVEDDPGHRAVAVCRARRPALVLGSTQDEAIVDRARAAARGVEVTRRRSGGGAVLITPHDPLWVDVWVPAGDPLFDDDVGRAFYWLGELWADALRGLGAGALTVVHGPSPRLEGWAAAVCFAAASSGEVVTADGRKVVGLAQRRARAGSHFHGACIGTWDAGALVGLLAVTPGEEDGVVDELAGRAVGLSALVDSRPAAALGHVAEAVLDTLP